MVYVENEAEVYPKIKVTVDIVHSLISLLNYV